MTKACVPAFMAVVVLLTLQSLPKADCRLHWNYYFWRGCPNAEYIIKQTVINAYSQDQTIPAGLIRLHFHDCFVRGCDASVLLRGVNGTLTEMDGPPNANSLRGFDIIDAAKANVEAVCPGVVSCADIVAYAARDAIELAAGLTIRNWLGGRRDGMISNFQDTLTALPSPSSDFQTLVQTFQHLGLSTREMVILSGAHSIGHAHCGAFLSRLYNFNGTGLPDPSINPTYLTTLQPLCPSTSPGTLVNMDQTTPLILDGDYWTDVLAGRGLFTSDAALRTTYLGRNLLRFATGIQPQFVDAMRKMGQINVLLGKPGEPASEIRLNCSLINSPLGS